MTNRSACRANGHCHRTRGRRAGLLRETEWRRGGARGDALEWDRDRREANEPFRTTRDCREAPRPARGSTGAKRSPWSLVSAAEAGSKTPTTASWARSGAAFDSRPRSMPLSIHARHAAGVGVVWRNAVEPRVARSHDHTSLGRSPWHQARADIPNSVAMRRIRIAAVNSIRSERSVHDDSFRPLRRC
jgi:hypothetical protein